MSIRSPGERWGIKTCETCGKKCYASRKIAKDSARAVHPSERMSVYRCGDYWHYGHMPNAVRFGVLPRGAQR